MHFFSRVDFTPFIAVTDPIISPACCFAGDVNNERYGSYSFEISMDTVLHGFAGYFDTVLYKESVLSEYLTILSLHTKSCLLVNM